MGKQIAGLDDAAGAIHDAADRAGTMQPTFVMAEQAATAVAGSPALQRQQAK